MIAPPQGDNLSPAECALIVRARDGHVHNVEDMARLKSDIEALKSEERLFVLYTAACACLEPDRRKRFKILMLQQPYRPIAQEVFNTLQQHMRSDVRADLEYPREPRKKGKR